MVSFSNSKVKVLSMLKRMRGSPGATENSKQEQHKNQFFDLALSLAANDNGYLDQSQTFRQGPKCKLQIKKRKSQRISKYFLLSGMKSYDEKRNLLRMQISPYSQKQ